jgi:ubiquinone biosynthesis accessory factor UbiK
MITSIHQLFEQIQPLLPKEDLISRQDLKRLFESAASRLDLVTRDEFDAQTAVLQRTRAKLELLEAKLAELEQKKDSN